eukprot:7260449-Pyramimonas_sp.AAC.1
MEVPPQTPRAVPAAAGAPAPASSRTEGAEETATFDSVEYCEHLKKAKFDRARLELAEAQTAHEQHLSITKGFHK